MMKKDKSKKISRKEKKSKKIKDHNFIIDAEFLQELGIELSLLEEESGKKKAKGGKIPYQAKVQGKRKRSSYRKLFSAGGWDLEKNPVKDETYIDNGPFQKERIYSGNGEPQNIDVHARPPGMEEKTEEPEKRHEREKSYPCGGRLRAYFHRAEYTHHSSIPGELGHRKISRISLGRSE